MEQGLTFKQRLALDKAMEEIGIMVSSVRFSGDHMPSDLLDHIRDEASGILEDYVLGGELPNTIVLNGKNHVGLNIYARHVGSGRIQCGVMWGSLCPPSI